VICFTHRKVKIKLPIPNSEKLMAKSKPFKGKVEIKLDSTRVPRAVPKVKSSPKINVDSVNRAAKTISIPPSGKPKEKEMPVVFFDPPEIDDVSADEIWDLMESLNTDYRPVPKPSKKNPKV
jgi:hypothetical protein